MAAQNLANTKQDLIAALVQKELKESASLLPFVTDYSSLAVKGSKSISIPKLSSFTVQSRTFGAAASENTALVDSVDTIDLDHNKIVLFGFDSADAYQSTLDYKLMAINRASSAHGRALNSEIITVLTNVAGYNINAGTPADIAIDDILNMRKFLIQNFADMNKVVLLIAADQEAVMLQLPEFSKYDYRGGGESPIVNGMIGRVYGVPVVVHQQVPAQQAFMFEASGVGFAFQQNPAVGEMDDVSYGSAGKKVAVDTVYGVDGLQIATGVQIDNSTPIAAGKSGLVAKLAN